MHLVKHAAITLGVGVLLLLLLGKPVLSIELLLILAGSVLIDIDHLWLPSVRKRVRKPRKLHEYLSDRANEYLGELKLFHTYEFQLLILLLGLLVWQPLVWLWLGLFLHLLEDAYSNTRKKKLDWLPDYSLVYRVIRAAKTS